MKYINGAYQSHLFTGIPGLVHGYSSRELGDARKPEYAKTFVKRITGKDAKMLRASQVHGASVALVGADSPEIIPEADGMVTADKSIVLEVHVADCVPLLLVDPVAKISAVAHAGWRGTFGRIARNTVDKMRDAGAVAENIRVSVGPHIGRCCYVVDEARAQSFLNEFGFDERIAGVSEGGWHLDLGFVNRNELLAAGITEEHIDAPVTCTSCQIDNFFSYRKDTKETFGEIIGIVGYMN
ncbi:peptidoglycan editing factor PgeF [Candidatus Gottesmanbacteria bacterium]|nr:peptidoglycan editing factor PgeF [Candidatus Gottesmanbacteria bacterium]